jgi:hypothetical protein
MFAFPTSSRPLGARPPLPDQLKERAKPVLSASSRTIDVDPALQTLLPRGTFQRGTTTVLIGPEGSGATSLGISLMAHASSIGHWCGVVGAQDPGVAAMKELGLDVRRVIFVPHPRAGWADAAAELLDGVDVLLLCPPRNVPFGAARRLMARAKERRSVLLVRTTTPTQWPIVPEMTMSLTTSSWQGVGHGDGYLTARRVLVTVHGRRDASQPTERWLWLPSRHGAASMAE